MQYYIYTLSDPISKNIKYIGKTKDLKDRLIRHMTPSNLKNTWTSKSKWLKYLKNNDLKPIMEVLDIGDENNIDDLEIYWIEQFKHWGFKLKNETTGGTIPTPKGSKLTDRHINNLQESYNKKKKPVCQYTLDNKFVKEYESITEAKEKTKISHISCCCRGVRNSAGGYYFRYKDNFFPYVDKNDYWTGNKHTKETIKKLKQINPFKKVVYQYNIISNKKINEYESLHDAADKTGLQRGHISKCCNGIKGFNSVGGYYFRFKEEYFPFVKQYASLGKLKKNYNININ